MSISLTLIVFFHSIISFIDVTNCLIQVFDQKVLKSSLLGNFSDVIVDIGEDVLLECDQNNDSISFEWYRNEEKWFDKDVIPQRIPSNEKYLLINENKVSTVLYKCLTRSVFSRTSGDHSSDLIKSYKLYIDRLPKRKRGLSS